VHLHAGWCGGTCSSPRLAQHPRAALAARQQQEPRPQEVRLRRAAQLGRRGEDGRVVRARVDQRDQLVLRQRLQQALPQGARE